MNRSVVALLALSVAAAAQPGCNVPVCGKGTKQIQDPSGELRCVQSDSTLETPKCDVDGGAFLEGAVCKTRTLCDPATTRQETTPDGKIVCVGMGGNNCIGTMPKAGNVSFQGTLFDWETGIKLAAGARNVRITAHDPLKFLGGDRTILQNGEKVTADGCFAINDIPNPATSLVALATDDAPGAADELILAGSGAQTMVAGRVYQVDLFLVKKATVEAWKTQTGTDWAASGAYLPCYYADTFTNPDINTLEFAKMPVNGVQIFQVGTNSTPPSAKYFTNATTLGTGTSTTAFGCGLSLPPGVPPGPPSIDLFTGMGGTCGAGACNWQRIQGSSAAGVIFFSRFHQQ